MRRSGWLIAAGVVLVAAAVVAGAVGFGGRSGADTTSEPTARAMPPATAEVTRTTLVETLELSGTLAYPTEDQAVADVAGTVTWVPEIGEAVRRGEPLYRIDDVPVVLMRGSVPAYRPMREGDEGGDVRQLKRNLNRLGYNSDDTFDADDDGFDEATAEAVRDWQDDLGMEATGVVEPGRVVFGSSEVRISDHAVARGARVQPGQTVLSYGGLGRQVTAQLDVADQDLAEVGGEVEIELPDGAVVAGVIEEIGTVATADDSGQASQSGGAGSGSGAGQQADPASAQLELVIAPVDPPAADEAFGTLDAAPVIVRLISEERADVLAVPVAALLALREGGYGVEVVDGDATTIVSIETGMFADGLVEVTEGNLAEGAKVGVPRR